MSKGNPFKRIAAAVLALCLCLIGPLSGRETVRADNNAADFYVFGGSFYVSEQSEAKTDESYIYRFQLSWDMRLGVRFVVPYNVAVEIKVFSGESTSVSPVYQRSLSDTAWLYDMNSGLYFSQLNPELKGGTYTLQVTFKTASAYFLALAEEYSESYKNEPSTTAHSGRYVGPASSVDIGTGDPAGSDSPTIMNSKMSQTSLTLVNGFQAALEVLNPPGVPIIWESGTPAVASVDENGVVTAKREGYSRITARTEYDTGRLKWISCLVHVVPNRFKEEKVFDNKCKVQVCEAYFDWQGNLRMKCKVVNGGKKDVKSMRNLKIVFKDNMGKTIGTFTLKRKDIYVFYGSYGDFEVKLKASGVKRKNADLTTASYKATAKFKYSAK